MYKNNIIKKTKIYRNIEDAEDGIIIEDGAVVGTTCGEVLKLDTLKNVVKIGGTYYIYFTDGDDVFCVSCDMTFPYQWIKSDDSNGIKKSTNMGHVIFMREGNTR